MKHTFLTREQYNSTNSRSNFIVIYRFVLIGAFILSSLDLRLVGLPEHGASLMSERNFENKL